jgi:hypothetical protein
VARLSFLALNGVADGAQDRAPVAFPLHQIVLGALVEDAHGEFLVVLSAQHDDGNLAVYRLDGVEALQAGAVGKMQVEQDDIIFVATELLGRPGEGRDIDEFDIARALATKRRSQKFHVRRIVINQQQFH